MTTAHGLMRTRALIFALLSAASTAHAAMSIEFVPKAHVSDCPSGAVYPVLQCKDHITELPKVTLSFQDAGDGFWIAEYKAEGAGTWTSFSQMNFMLYPHHGKTVLSLTISTGFDADEKRNPQSYFEAVPKHFPDWMLITGERRPSPDQKFEVLAEFEFADLKFHP